MPLANYAVYARKDRLSNQKTAASRKNSRPSSCLTQRATALAAATAAFLGIIGDRAIYSSNG